MYTETVKVPSDFFEKDKRQYRNWMYAFFRELVQNSFDARSSKIDFTFKQNDDFIIVECIDNGKGMDRDVITDVFLCLGGSVKEEGAVGGFGQAKIIILFAHQEYEIYSKNSYVNGKGGNYNLSETEQYFEGTKVVVKMKKDDGSYGKHTEGKLINQLKSVMEYSELSGARVSFNGEVINSISHKFDYNIETPIGHVRFSDCDGSYSSLYVRIGGLTMFNHEIWGENGSSFVGVLDLDKCSKDVLTANRDSLSGDLQVVLNGIFQTLSKERSSLKINRLIDFTINETARLGEQEIASQINHNYMTPDSFKKLAGQREQNGSSSINKTNKYRDLVEKSPFQIHTKKLNEEVEKINGFLARIKKDLYPSDFKIKKDEGSKITYSEMGKILNQAKHIKNAYRWKAIVEALLGCDMARDYGVSFYTEANKESTYSHTTSGKYYRYGRDEINIGFIFSGEVEGATTTGAECITIMMNPLMVKDDDGFEEMFDLAVHEVSHVIEIYHSERFCVIMDQMRKSFRKKWKINQVEKNSKDMIKVNYTKNVKV
jgi:hypothetical protein